MDSSPFRLLRAGRPRSAGARYDFFTRSELLAATTIAAGGGAAKITEM